MHRQAATNEKLEKLNIYTLSVVSFLGLGCLSFGYGASVIGTLLGTFHDHARSLERINNLQVSRLSSSTLTLKQQPIALALFLL
jgi:hypothetical protein